VRLDKPLDVSGKARDGIILIDIGDISLPNDFASAIDSEHRGEALISGHEAERLAFILRPFVNVDMNDIGASERIPHVAGVLRRFARELAGPTLCRSQFD
jgi:hypothetical protein